MYEVTLIIAILSITPQNFKPKRTFEIRKNDCHKGKSSNGEARETSTPGRPSSDRGLERHTPGQTDEELGWEPLHLRCWFRRLTVLYKCMHGLRPKDLADPLPPL